MNDLTTALTGNWMDLKWIVIGLVLMAILWGFAKVIAKLGLVLITVWTLVMIAFCWQEADYHRFFPLEPYLSVSTHTWIHERLADWDDLRASHGLLWEPSDSSPDA